MMIISRNSKQTLVIINAVEHYFWVNLTDEIPESLPKVGNRETEPRVWMNLFYKIFTIFYRYQFLECTKIPDQGHYIYGFIKDF